MTKYKITKTIRFKLEAKIIGEKLNDDIQALNQLIIANQCDNQNSY